MAHPNFKLIEALRKAAQNLRNGADYAWGHHVPVIAENFAGGYPLKQERNFGACTNYLWRVDRNC